MSKVVLTLPNSEEAIEKENKQLKARFLLLKKVHTVDEELQVD